MKMNRGPRQPARDPVCLSAASGGRGSCFRSAARAYAARTRAYFSLVGKVGKSTPEPAALDSLAHRLAAILYVLFTLRSGRLFVLRRRFGPPAVPRSCGYALPVDFAAAPIEPACFPVSKPVLVCFAHVGAHIVRPLTKELHCSIGGDGPQGRRKEFCRNIRNIP